MTTKLAVERSETTLKVTPLGASRREFPRSREGRTRIFGARRSSAEFAAERPAIQAFLAAAGEVADELGLDRSA